LLLGAWSGVEGSQLDPYWWGGGYPLVVKGSGFNREGETVIVTVYNEWGGFLAQHSVVPSRDRCNFKGICSGGGSFSTSLSATEINLHPCPILLWIEAYDPTLSTPTVSIEFDPCLA
jgi:hypothetical protein